MPSHLTIFTSQPLASHGVIGTRCGCRGAADRLPDAFRTAGYRTAAFVSAQHLGPGGLLAPLLRELEAYKRPAPAVDHLDGRGDERTRSFRWLRGACRDPFVLWVHYFDPHMPYAPPAPYDTAYYDGRPLAAGAASLADVALHLVRTTRSTRCALPGAAGRQGPRREARARASARATCADWSSIRYELPTYANGDHGRRARVRSQLRELGRRAAPRPPAPPELCRLAHRRPRRPVPARPLCR